MEQKTNNRGGRNQMLSAIVHFLLRRRHPGLTVMRAGLSIYPFVMGGYLWSVAIRVSGHEIGIRLGGELSPVVWVVLFTTATVMVVAGPIWTWRDSRRDSRRRVIVVEVRGLRDTSGSPLVDAVPRRVPGHREPLLLNLRQRVADGMIVNPQRALDRLASLPAELTLREDGIDRRDVTIVCGGLAPVPFTFLTGTLIDDEGSVLVMDWDRHLARWRELDGVDDGNRFAQRGLQTLPPATVEAALAVSVSYKVDIGGIRQKLAGVPIIELTLRAGSTDSHWSKDKQTALGRHFLNTAIALGNSGVACIHLFLAAPNSMVFRFGQLYDWRNLPTVVVYQYERQHASRFPWGAKMPTSGKTVAELVE